MNNDFQQYSGKKKTQHISRPYLTSVTFTTTLTRQYLESALQVNSKVSLLQSFNEHLLSESL